MSTRTLANALVTAACALVVIHPSTGAAQVPPEVARLLPTGVTVAYDRFKDLTMATVRVNVENRFLLSGAYAMPGKRPAPLGRDAVVSFILMSSSTDGWRYSDCHDVSLLVDGRPMVPVYTMYDAQISGRFAVEYQLFGLSIAQARALAWAAVAVEGRVCKTEFALHAKELAELRDWLSRMNPGP